MGFDFGAALTSLGKSAPGIGQSFDDSRRQREEDELKRQQVAAALKQLAQEGKINDQTLASNDYKQKRTTALDTETDQKKAAAKSAYQSWSELKNQSEQAQTIGGEAGIQEGGYAGPYRPEYKSKLGALAGKTPVQQMNEFDFPMHAAADEGIKNTYEAAVTDEDKKEAIGAAAAKAGETSRLTQEQRDETERHNREMERLAGTKGTGGGLGANTYNLSEPEQASLANAVQNGFDPYKINSRTAKIIANLDRDTGGKVQWNTAAANAQFERATATQNTQSLLNTIDPLLDNLKQKGNELGNTGFPLLNKGINLGKEMVGRPSITAFNNARDDAVAELERGLLGTGVLSDSKYMRALHNVNSAQSPEQLSAAIEQMKIAIKSRLEAINVQTTRPTGLDKSAAVEEKADPLGIR